jgi:hypothetical protein
MGEGTRRGVNEDVVAVAISQADDVSDNRPGCAGTSEVKTGGEFLGGRGEGSREISVEDRRREGFNCGPNLRVRVKF